MDGAPVKGLFHFHFLSEKVSLTKIEMKWIGEAIPVRLFLGGFDLTPTYKDVVNKFSVSYILNLVLVDEDDRRYFKQREIVLWRKSEKGKKYANIEGAQTYEEGLPTNNANKDEE